MAAERLRTLLLKVPAWAKASSRRGSNRSIAFALPPKAPKVRPPPRYFPKVTKSGFTFHFPCSPLGDSREVITSSKIKKAPTFCVSSRSILMKLGCAWMQPPLPVIGSTMIAANSSPSSWIFALVPSTSLYVQKFQENGTFI